MKKLGFANFFAKKCKKCIFRYFLRFLYVFRFGHRFFRSLIFIQIIHQHYHLVRKHDRIIVRMAVYIGIAW